MIRPILMGNVIDSDLIRLCVEFAADACQVSDWSFLGNILLILSQSAKVLSLNPQIPPDRITVYHCFYCGITLLQCLAIKPTALTPRCAHQAISACLSALAVYTRVLPAVAPFLRLFEDLSNLLVCDDHGSEIHPSPEVRNVLNRIISSDPSETPRYVNDIPLLIRGSKYCFTGFYICFPIKKPDKPRCSARHHGPWKWNQWYGYP